MTERSSVFSRPMRTDPRQGAAGGALRRAFVLLLLAAVVLCPAAFWQSAGAVSPGSVARPLSSGDPVELGAFQAGAGEQFGTSVAVTSLLAFVGSPYSEIGTGTVTGSGGVYVLERRNRRESWGEKATIAPNEATGGDKFGRSLSYGKVSGVHTLVVGAPGQNGSAGAVYVFTRSRDVWSQVAKFSGADTAANDRFGATVLLRKNSIVIGAPGHNGSQGAVYVFTGTGSQWSEAAELTASDGTANDGFGSSVAAEANTNGSMTIFVGAPGHDGSAGSTYVFKGSGQPESWRQAEELDADGEVANDLFGSSLAVADKTLVVGAPGQDSSAGATYLFSKDPGRWSEKAAVTAPDGSAHDEFGFSVAIYESSKGGGQIAAGAPGHDSSGSIYLFSLTGQEISETTPPDGTAGALFGSAVALYGGVELVGAPSQSSSRGEAYLGSQEFMPVQKFGFKSAISGTTALVSTSSYGGLNVVIVLSNNGSSWSESAQLMGSGETPGDGFGNSLAIDGNTAVVSDPGHNDAYVFVNNGSGWTQAAQLSFYDPYPELSGIPVGISGTMIVVGAPSAYDTTGAAYVFTQNGSTWTESAQLRSSDDAYEWGTGVAISGNTIVVNGDVFELTGSTWSQTQVLSAAGPTAISGSTMVVGTGTSAEIFAQTGSIWKDEATLTGLGEGSSDDFGGSVAIDNGIVIVGAPDHAGGQGAAYAFTDGASGWMETAEISPPSQFTTFGSSVGVSDSTGVIGAPSSLGEAYLYSL